MNACVKVSLWLAVFFGGIVAVVVAVVMIAAGLPDAGYAALLRIIEVRAPMLSLAGVRLLSHRSGQSERATAEHPDRIASSGAQTAAAA